MTTLILGILIWTAGVFTGWGLRDIKLNKAMTKALEYIRKNYGVSDYQKRFLWLFNRMDDF